MKSSNILNTNKYLPIVTAVVLSYNEAEDTIKCVQSLLTINYPKLKIIIVDNASTDGSQLKIRSTFPTIKFVQRATNGGYAEGNNTGIQIALEENADYILVSNSDVIVSNDFLLPMLNIAEAQSDIGVVACTVRYQSNPDEIYYAAGKFSRLFCTGLNITRKYKRLINENKECDVDFVNGALLLFRRNVFEELGLFSEKFFLYFDDLEFSRRYASRFRLVYTPKSVVYHKSGAGKGWRSYTESYLYYHTRNRFWVFRDEQAWYRIYVVLFSFVDSFTKLLVISANIFTNSRRFRKQSIAIIRGLRDGLFLKGLQ